MDTSNIVGEKIKMLREEREISRETLAEKSGLSLDQIKRIEDNINIPSLSPLIKIARVLGVRLGTFLDGTEEAGPTVCRADEESDTISFSNNDINAHKQMSYRSLSRDRQDRHMEPFMIDIEEIEQSNYELSSHEGEEFIFVLKGKMEVFYGDQTYQLNVGDSIYYDSVVPHHVHSAKDNNASILAVIYTPI
ncbi:MAG: XRE family transcriptional regulator [Bacteroidaceae bacterium]